MFIGDLKKDALEKIWRSPAAQRMRLRLKYNFKRDRRFWGVACPRLKHVFCLGCRCSRIFR